MNLDVEFETMLTKSLLYNRVRIGVSSCGHIQLGPDICHGYASYNIFSWEQLSIALCTTEVGKYFNFMKLIFHFTTFMQRFIVRADKYQFNNVNA